MVEAKEMLWFHMTLDSPPWYKGTEGPIAIVYDITWKLKHPFKQQTLKHPKLVQLDKV
jgi:hypothetical protein